MVKNLILAPILAQLAQICSPTKHFFVSFTSTSS